MNIVKLAIVSVETTPRCTALLEVSNCFYCGNAAAEFPRQCCPEGRRFDELYEISSHFEGAPNTEHTRAQLQCAIQEWCQREVYGNGADTVQLWGVIVDSLWQRFGIYAEAGYDYPGRFLGVHGARTP